MLCQFQQCVALRDCNWRARLEKILDGAVLTRIAFSDFVLELLNLQRRCEIETFYDNWRIRQFRVTIRRRRIPKTLMLLY
jgi:hypothetical protein